MAILPWNLRLDPVSLDSYSIADEDNALAYYPYPSSIQQRLITQRADAFNKWNDTFSKINDWKEFIESHPDAYTQFMKDEINSRRKYDNDQIISLK